MPQAGDSVDPVLVAKGDRVRVRVVDNYKFVALAGVQVKLQVRSLEFDAVVRHVRGNHPEQPTEVMLYVDPGSPLEGLAYIRPPGCTCALPHVAVRPEQVTGVLDP